MADYELWVKEAGGEARLRSAQNAEADGALEGRIGEAERRFVDKPEVEQVWVQASDGTVIWSPTDA